MGLAAFNRARRLKAEQQEASETSNTEQQKATDYSNMTKEQLIEYAISIGIDISKCKNKGDIIAELTKAEETE